MRVRFCQFSAHPETNPYAWQGAWRRLLRGLNIKDVVHGFMFSIIPKGAEEADTGETYVIID